MELDMDKNDYKLLSISSIERLCPDCNKPIVNQWCNKPIVYQWCKHCIAKRFQQDFHKWTSGNKFVDKFIQESQLNATWNNDVLEWIPYNRLANVKYLDKGEFSTVYRAIWLDGPIQ